MAGKKGARKDQDVTMGRPVLMTGTLGALAAKVGTIDKLAAELGVSKRTLQRWNNEEVAIPRAACFLVAQLARKHGIPVDRRFLADATSFKRTIAKLEKPQR